MAGDDVCPFRKQTLDVLAEAEVVMHSRYTDMSYELEDGLWHRWLNSLIRSSLGTTFHILSHVEHYGQRQAIRQASQVKLNYPSSNMQSTCIYLHFKVIISLYPVAAVYGLSLAITA